MVRCPSYIKGFEKIKWFFNGYSHHLKMTKEDIEDLENDENYCFLRKIIYEIIYSLRDRKYEFFLMEFDNSSKIEFVQAVKYGDVYRTEYRIRYDDGSAHLFEASNVPVEKCFHIVFMICAFGKVEKADWKEFFI